MYVGDAPQIQNLIEKMSAESVAGAIAAGPDPRACDGYPHWHDLQRREPPAGLTAEQWWLKLKVARREDRRELPLLDRQGEPLGYTLPAIAQRSLYRIDQLGGSGAGPGALGTTPGEVRKRFFVAALMEEAIRSSQLEGAMTSRGDAKEMLRSGRPPRDRSERMIANNYRALQFMREQTDSPLTTERILELHRVLTADTLADPSAVGRLQQPGEERVRVLDRDGGRVVHTPPPAEQLPERMERLCEFANATDDSEPFVHPVIRAILLHFWLAYDHPFLDGNGRTARILFFWAMRSRGYRLAEYLPISRQLRGAPAQYGEAFLQVETDGGDVTYFLLHQLGVLGSSIDDFDRDARQKADEQRDVKQLLDEIEGINGRQQVLLTHALKHPNHTYTFGGHASSNRVTHETARTDLNGLVEKGLLARRRRGRTYIFRPPPDLPERLKESTR